MGKPIKFRVRIPPIRIVNRCIMCGRVIPSGRIICDYCARKKRRLF